MSTPPEPADDSRARLEREALFHDNRFAEETRAKTDKFYEITTASAQHYSALIQDDVAGQKVLEYGCGTGSAAYDLAALGGTVVGIDISPVAIDLATQEAERRGVEDRTEFHVGNAEDLPFPDGHFDVVCGTGILHHLDLRLAYPEIKRVLGPGGRGVFYEPLGHNPLINWYRNRTPNMRTEDEHPLLKADLQEAERIFPHAAFTFFHLTALGSVPLRRTPIFRKLSPALDRVDSILLSRNSPLRHQAWMVVMDLRM